MGPASIIRPTLASTEIYLNGRWLPAAEARLPADDRGLAFSEGLFETFRVKGGRACLIADHLARLRASCAFLGIPYPEADLEAIAIEGARRHGLADAGVRVTVTAGAGGDLAGPGERPGALIVQVRPALGPGIGLRLHIASLRQSATSVLMRHKTLRYLERVLAIREARAKGADEAVFLNDRGEVAEATTASVFWVKGGAVLTPSMDANILPGVTRTAALAAARELGLKVSEVLAGPEALRGADEAFITSATRGVAYAASVDGKRIGDGRMGPVTAKLAAAVEKKEDGYASSSPGPQARTRGPFSGS